MASKTLIRSKKHHEVKLGEGSHVAQSPQQHVDTEAAAPTMIRKTSPSRRTASVTEVQSGSPAGSKIPVRKKPAAAAAQRTPAVAARKRSSAATADKTPPSPRLPAHVPADGLWEVDSTVMQRLQALIQHNAQLSEQLQRLQNNPLPKGYKP